MQALKRTIVVLSWLMILPASAFAQSALAGVVKDTSGAVLPGVTVEASSPSLIEKVRSAITDARGQYRITELTPGTYTVTFTLPGFATIQREGVGCDRRRRHHDQRGHARRHHRRNDDGDRRDARRRHPDQYQTSDDDPQRGDRVDSGVARATATCWRPSREFRQPAWT